jgi:hypothetical protein
MSSTFCNDFFAWICKSKQNLEEIGIDSEPNLEGNIETLEIAMNKDQGDSNGRSYKIKQLFNGHGYNLSIMRGHVKGTKKLHIIKSFATIN